MRTRVRFIGLVQGVGFRATARDCARRLHVVGWVRNEEDGSVLMEAQAPEQTLTQLIADIRARMGENIRGVDRAVLVDAIGPECETDFEIRR